jgi:uridylate kinase
MDAVKIISLGGSLIAPDKPDTGFLSSFGALIRKYLDGDKARKVILICGGGGPARVYQQAFRTVSGAADHDREDWIGIKATHLNAELVRHILGGYCKDRVVTDPTGTVPFTGRVLVAAGWKPGFSTDYDAVVLAQRFEARTVVNLSNVRKVHTADPRKDPSAKPIDAIDWAGFIAIIGDKWEPGKNVPFDPVATRKAAGAGLKVIIAEGKDLDNLSRILEETEFEGTVIGPG